MILLDERKHLVVRLHFPADVGRAINETREQEHCKESMKAAPEPAKIARIEEKRGKDTAEGECVEARQSIACA